VVVVLNLPFWVIGQSMLLERPMLTYESVLIAWLLSRRPGLALVLGLAATAIDGVVSLSRIYMFATPGTLLNAARFGDAIDWRYQIDVRVLAMAALFAAATWAAWRLARQACFSRRVGLMVLCSLLALDLGNGSFSVGLFKQPLVDLNLAGTPTLQFIGALNGARQADSLPLAAIKSGESAQDMVDWSAWMHGHPDGRVLLVVVESMGLPLNPAVRQWMLGRLDSPPIRQRFDVRQSSVRFRGSTTAAELRLLCRLEADYRSVDKVDGTLCLPSRMQAGGWRTAGYHGFTGGMFDRTMWWPRLGLQESYFAEALLATDDARCGRAFRGACDVAVMDRAIRFLEKPRSFAYVLTLNTHLPISPVPIPEDLRQICGERAAGADCELVAAHGALLDALSQRLQRVPAGTLVLIVGDHAPPFSLLSERQSFDPNHVPALLLSPRE
jgi:hypothetical protein